jgi:hypothetical protein
MLLAGDDQAAIDRNQWVWLLAACQRGYDCGPNSDWVRMRCSHDNACQPFESVSDIVRRITGPKFDSIVTRAGEINDHIDRGDYENLGI